MTAFPSSATTLHFEYFSEDSANKKLNALNVIHMDNIDQIDKSLAQIMEEMVETYKVPTEKQMLLFTHLRLAKSFSNYKQRLQCVQARLQALSIIGKTLTCHSLILIFIFSQSIVRQCHCKRTLLRCCITA